MEYDTINYYLLFNKDAEVLVFLDPYTGDVLYPEKEERTCDETIESKIAKLTMALKEKNSNNDTLIMKKNENAFTRKSPFMSRVREMINVSDAELLESYNGEYKLIEYSEGRFFLEVDYLKCNYYAKYIELTKEYITKLKTLCSTYNYEIDFVKFDDILAKEEGQFESSKKHIRKLQKVINHETC